MKIGVLIPRKLYAIVATVSDKFEKRHGIENYRNWLRFDEKQLNRHMFILGTTGAGKTETINRIIWEVLQNTNRDVFVIDGKGETKLIEAYDYSIKIQKILNNL